MKKQTIIFLDPDLIETEQEPREVDCTIVLTPEQSIELAVCSCLKINGRFYYKKARYDSIFNVNGSRKPGELIAETNSAVFILSPRQYESLPAAKPLVIPEHVIQEERIKDNYYNGIMSRVPVR
jgi:hypothetical protein